MDKSNIQDLYPLAPMQQGMLFHSIYAPQAEMYIEQITCTLRGDLNVAAFERAWQRALADHAILRTAFVWEGVDAPLQIVLRDVCAPFAHFDWRALTRAEQAAQFDACLRAERARGFDLARAPLMRLALARVAEDAWRFVWTHHHILLDGWSLPLLLKNVFAAYAAFARAAEPQIEPARPYREYIAWLQNQDAASAEKFWRDALKGFTAPTPLGVDRADSRADGYAIRREQFSPELTAAVQTFAREHHLTLNTVLQGAWAILLSRYSGEDDVVFGATVAGRPADLPGAETMIGLFINTLPVRVRVPPDAPLLSWLNELQARQVELRQHEHTALTQIQGWSEVPRGAALFESILVFENYPVGADAPIPGLAIADVCSFSKTNYPLTLALQPGRALACDVAYDCRRFDAATIARLVGHLQTLLGALPTRLDQPLATLPLLTRAEQQQQFVAWNNTTANFPRQQCIHHLIEQQAACAPDAIAARCGREALTYRELDARANQLARHLQKLGVMPDTLVALCVERSLEMLVGILGILKAGGAYLPLDPAYPAERLAFMLNDANARVLITHKRLAHRLPHHPNVVCIDRDWHTIAQESDAP